MKEIKPKAELLNYSSSSENNVAISAKLTHSEKRPQELDKQMGEDKKEKLVKHMIDLNHQSTLEHTYFFFHIQCSRATANQIVRHRVGTSYSQRSQRYVDEGEFEYIVPPSMEKYRGFYTTRLEQMSQDYQAMRVMGVPKEDARFLLPNIATHMTVSFNARSLRHFLNLRLDSTAQWEIRSIANQILEQVKGVTPSLFEDIQEEE